VKFEVVTSTGRPRGSLPTQAVFFGKVKRLLSLLVAQPTAFVDDHDHLAERAAPLAAVLDVFSRL
jgi:hypothetical protein